MAWKGECTHAEADQQSDQRLAIEVVLGRGDSRAVTQVSRECRENSRGVEVAGMVGDQQEWTVACVERVRTIHLEARAQRAQRGCQQQVLDGSAQHGDFHRVASRRA